MDLKSKKTELEETLAQERQRLELALINIHRVEGALALTNAMIAEVENEDVPTDSRADPSADSVRSEAPEPPRKRRRS
jgi:hypothetical protein